MTLENFTQIQVTEFRVLLGWGQTLCLAECRVSIHESIFIFWCASLHHHGLWMAWSVTPAGWLLSDTSLNGEPVVRGPPPLREGSCSVSSVSPVCWQDCAYKFWQSWQGDTSFLCRWEGGNYAEWPLIPSLAISLLHNSILVYPMNWGWLIIFQVTLCDSNTERWGWYTVLSLTPGMIFQHQNAWWQTNEHYPQTLIG